MIGEGVDWAIRHARDFVAGNDRYTGEGEHGLQTRFAITFMCTVQIEGGVGGTLLRYCVHDPTNEIWCVYNAVCLTVGVGAGYSSEASESSRWVEFEAEHPSRVTDFGGEVGFWGAGISTPEAINPVAAAPSYFYFAHPLLPPTVGETGAQYRARLDAWRRGGGVPPGEEGGLNNSFSHTVPSWLYWVPWQHFVALNTGSGAAAEISFGCGAATPQHVDSDANEPWAGFSPP